LPVGSLADHEDQLMLAFGRLAELGCCGNLRVCGSTANSLIGRSRPATLNCLNCTGLASDTGCCRVVANTGMRSGGDARVGSRCRTQEPVAQHVPVVPFRFPHRGRQGTRAGRLGEGAPIHNEKSSQVNSKR